MNPAKLKALVDQSSQSPDLAPLVGMSPPPDDGEDYSDTDDEDEPEAPADPMARGNELISSWGEQGEALKESAGELVDGAHEIGGDLLLATVPEDASDEVEDQFDGMPEEIQICLAQLVAPLPDPDLTALATALISDNDGDTETPDVKLVTAYLKAVAAIALQEVDPDDFVQPEEDEDEEDDEDEDEDAAPAPATADGVSASPVAAPTKPLA